MTETQGWILIALVFILTWAVSSKINRIHAYLEELAHGDAEHRQTKAKWRRLGEEAERSLRKWKEHAGTSEAGERNK
jgi:hypothetical protein